MSFNLQSLKQKAQTRVFSEIRKAQDAQINAEKLILENNKSLFETKDIAIEKYDIFLSHKSDDAEVVLGLLEKLKAFGYSVYVDWIDDPHLDRNNINKNTSNALRERMNQSRCLFFATTEHAADSKWMPWELGYMDGKKGTAAILPIFENEDSSSHTYEGQEYLSIYPYCIEATIKNKAIEKLWICETNDVYIRFDNWLKGEKPYKHID